MTEQAAFGPQKGSKFATVSDRTRTLKVAMIGCGCVAGYGHAPAIARSDELECVAYVDLDRPRAEEFARRFGGGDVYDDYRYVLERKDVDAVAVLTMPTAHCKIVIDALQAGKHVFVEKPISSSVEGAERMIAAARSCTNKLFVGFLLRHTSAYQKMAEVIHSGAIGQPAVYRMIGFEHYAPDDSFAWDRARLFMTETSPAMDCGTHYVDLMRWFSGAEATRVQGIGARINPTVPPGCFDWESYQIEFADGSTGIYEVGWGFTFPPDRMRKEAIGPRGRVEVHFGSIEEGKESCAETVFTPLGGTEEIVSRSEWKGFDGEWAYFARMIREDIEPYPQLNDALASLRIVSAGHRSAMEGAGLRAKP